MLDIGLSVATGRKWLGQDAKQAVVAYVSGEGASGIKKRVKAWKRHHQVASVKAVFFRLEPVQLTDRDKVTEFLASLKRSGIQPGLIVLDTLATCMVGVDENAAKDMGTAVDAMRRIQRETGAAVIVVHHTGKNVKKGAAPERGSGALRGAASAMIGVSINDGMIVVKNDKQKEDAAAENIHAHLKIVEMGVSKIGRKLTSCVLVTPDCGSSPSPDSGVLTRELREALEALAACPSGAGRWSEWHGHFRRLFDMSKETLVRRRAQLLQHGYVRSEGAGKYALTDRGRQGVMTVSDDVTGATVQSVSHPEGVTLTGVTTDFTEGKAA